MGRTAISAEIMRRLYCESMGRCMNPHCQKDLFSLDGDIIEKAHIVPYCDTENNSFDNLVVLCPNCHTDYDKNHAFSLEELKEWKALRKSEVERFFCKKFDSFDDLKSAVAPLLQENKAIYEQYYLNNEKALWVKFEPRILVNNRKIKLLIENNLNLIQRHKNEEYSNLACVQTFLLHVAEFETTRTDDEKTRCVLFPEEINSMFGVSPFHDFMIPSTETLEALITSLSAKGRFERIVLGIDNPYILINEDNESVRVSLDDTPRLRQLYHDNNCFRKVGVRLDSLNYALKYIRHKRLHYDFLHPSNLRNIVVDGKHIVFVYEYCLSKSFLQMLAPDEGCVIVNLHNWNGASCISQEAYEFAKVLNVTLLNMDTFYEYISSLQRK